jgi:hypothetical protein
MRRASKDVLTVEQAAEVLGVGRQTAYTQCRLFLAPNGSRDGIPCHRIGRLILIYRAEFEAWLGFAIEWPPVAEKPTAPPPAEVIATGSSPTRRPSSPRRDRRVTVDQQALPF